MKVIQNISLTYCISHFFNIQGDLPILQKDRTFITKGMSNNIENEE